MSCETDPCHRCRRDCIRDRGDGIKLYLDGCKIFDGPLCPDCVEAVGRFIVPKPRTSPESCGKPAGADCFAEGCCREPKPGPRLRTEEVVITIKCPPGEIVHCRRVPCGD